MWNKVTIEFKYMSLFLDLIEKILENLFKLKIKKLVYISQKKYTFKNLPGASKAFQKAEKKILTNLFLVAWIVTSIFALFIGWSTIYDLIICSGTVFLVETTIKAWHKHRFVIQDYYIWTALYSLWSGFALSYTSFYNPFISLGFVSLGYIFLGLALRERDKNNRPWVR